MRVLSDRNCKKLEAEANPIVRLTTTEILIIMAEFITIPGRTVITTNMLI